jgi:hypothetical protein
VHHCFARTAISDALSPVRFVTFPPRPKRGPLGLVPVIPAAALRARGGVVMPTVAAAAVAAALPPPLAIRVGRGT